MTGYISAVHWVFCLAEVTHVVPMLSVKERIRAYSLSRFFSLGLETDSSAEVFVKLRSRTRSLSSNFEKGCGPSCVSYSASLSPPAYAMVASSLLSGSSLNAGTGSSSQSATGRRADGRLGCWGLLRFFRLMLVVLMVQN